MPSDGPMDSIPHRADEGFFRRGIRFLTSRAVLSPITAFDENYPSSVVKVGSVVGVPCDLRNITPTLGSLSSVICIRPIPPVSCAEVGGCHCCSLFSGSCAIWIEV